MKKKLISLVVAGVMLINPMKVTEVKATPSQKDVIGVAGIARVFSECLLRNSINIDEMTDEEIANFYTEEEKIAALCGIDPWTVGKSTEQLVDAGYYSDIITTEEDDIVVEPEEVVESKEPEPVVQSTLTFDVADVTKVSGATEETFDKILEGTWLEGYGDIYYEMEKDYGINALFSIGNSIMETGWGGDNYLARHNNNIYGLNMSRHFSSKRDCIRYWFNLISKYYVGEDRLSIKSIGKKYCPPNANKWATDIPIIVRKLTIKADITLE